MQTLDVISVNFWQIVVSLCNLLILFLLVKKFLYQPVKKVLHQRQSTVDGLYQRAEEDAQAALLKKQEYENKLSQADQEAQARISSAVDLGRAREADIVSDAKEKADGILRRAHEETLLEKKRMRAGIKEEIVEVSTKLAEKMLEREIKAEDHKELIDSFLASIGDTDDADQ